jgi:DNA-binding CsgD family transcriptional regulator
MRLDESDITAFSGVLRELYAHTDATTLPHCIVRLLHHIIPADSAVYNSFDFRTGEMQVVHDHGPDGDRYLPALNAHIQQHPLLAHVRVHWQDGAASLSDVISHRQLRDQPIYREFLHPLGIERQLGLMVEDRQYGVAAVGLQRDGRDFSKRDKEILTLLQPHIIQAYKNALDLTAARNQASGFEGAIRVCDVGVVWLSVDEKAEWMSSRAQLWLNDYFPRKQAGHARSLPTPLSEWVRQQKSARKAGIGAGWKDERIFTSSRGQLKVRWISEQPDRSYLILSELRRNLAPEDFRPLGLTGREAEVLYWIAEGKSNEVIAIILTASKRTVEKHVEHILKKLGVETRVEAALRAAGYRQSF